MFQPSVRILSPVVLLALLVACNERADFAGVSDVIPITEDAEIRLHERGVLSIPDFIANAGGVICAAVEYAGGSETGAIETIAEKVRFNTLAALERAASGGTTPRAAAVALAEERVRRAMTFRRWSIF